MRSRWSKVPRLHTADHPARAVTWLELFVDAAFAAVIVQLGRLLAARVEVTHTVLAPVAGFAGLVVVLWVVWSALVFLSNRLAFADSIQRILVFVEVFAAVLVVDGAASLGSGEGHALFALSYALALAVIAVMYARAARRVEQAHSYGRYWTVVYALSALVWAASAWLPAAWAYALWGVSVFATLFSPISKPSRALAERFPVDLRHLSERFGFFVLFVMGASLVEVVAVWSAGAVAPGGRVVRAAVIVVFACTVWWMYFDDIAGSQVRRARGSWIVWLYGHLPLTVGVVGFGAAVAAAIGIDWSRPADPAWRWMTAGCLALVLFGVGIVDSVTERRDATLSDRARVNFRLASAVVVLLFGQITHAMTAGVFAGAMVAAALAQIVFDLVMAPNQRAATAEEADAVLIAELARRRQAGEAPRPKEARRRLDEAVRKGAPAELRRDLYFFLMEGSWTRLLFALGFVYLLVNVIFAGLFMLEPGAITGADTTSFADAFSFSIQTMSTIGYGALSPATGYANLLVAIEAAVGILGVALATGIMFAKASRPQASVLFSRPMVISQRHGKPTLMFRVGNARGNEVVEAAINVSVLCDEVSPEGHHLRRMHDLRLVRDRSPFFTLSWLVMHEIDEDSPLAGVDWAKPDAVILFAVTMRGHDATYGQTTFARRIYEPGDVQVGHRFVDVISETPDGQMIIDFTHFHDTVADEAASTQA